MSVQRTPSQQGGGGGTAGSLWVGPLLSRWNREDVSQFAAVATPHERDLGTAVPNAATALAIDYLADAGATVGVTDAKIGPAIRIVATSLAGGGVFRYQPSGLVLPEKYVALVSFLYSSSVFSLRPACYLYYTVDGGGDFQGVQIFRDGGSGPVGRNVVDNRNSDQEVLAGTAFGTSQFQDGGVRQLCEVYRQTAADNPAASRVLNRAFEPNTSSASEVNQDAFRPMSEANPAAGQWDGLNMDACGLGCWEGSNGTSGTVLFNDFRIYEHPDDTL